jgi:Cu/Ag efflux protein CusF
LTNPRRLLFASAIAAVLVPALPAHAAREFGRGNITAVDWQVMQIEIKTPQGGRLTYKVAQNCSVKFTDRAEEFKNPKLQDLTPPMYIHFVFENQTISEIDVREVGNIGPRSSTTDRGSSTDQGRSTDRGSTDRGSTDRGSTDRGSTDRSSADRRSSERGRPLSDRELKARILRIDERRGTFDADVAGRRQGFRTESRRLLRDLGEGDLVILSLDRRGGNEIVTDIRSAGQSGRVTRIDERRGEVTVEVRGRESVYLVDSPRLLRRLREGDRVTFEVEERRGRRVIVSIE